jgi:hypothetical protein
MSALRTSSRLIPALNSTFGLGLATTVGPVGGLNPWGRSTCGLTAVAGRVNPGGPPAICGPVKVADAPVVRVGVGGGGMVPGCVAPRLALGPVSPTGL